MGRISVMVAVENEIRGHVVLDRYPREERQLALRHLEAVAAFDRRMAGRRGHQGDLLLFDMGSPALYFMALMILQGKAFVIRTSDAFLKEVPEAIQSHRDDQGISIPLHPPDRPRPPKLSAHLPEIDPERVLSIRVIQLTRENGVREMLLSPLLDANRFPYTEFQGLYAKRWGSDTHYDVLKNRREIENFTGTSPRTVRQDCYATALTNHIRGLIHWELQDEVDQENQNSTRMDAYQLNKHLSIGRLKDRIVTLLVNQGNWQELSTDLKREMKRNRIPLRPGRQCPRTHKNRQQYTMTKRRALSIALDSLSW